MTRAADRKLEDLARRRAGVFTTREALEVGVLSSTLSRRERSGVYRRLHPGVYCVAGAPESVWMRYHAAVLAAGRGAVLSHQSAAHVWGLEGCRLPAHIHVRACGSRTSLTGVVVHRTPHLPVHHRTRQQDLPLTTVDRTLCDLSSVVDAAALRAAVVGAVRHRLIRADDLLRCLDELGRVRGAARMRALLHDLAPQEARTRSELESLFLRVITGAGLPFPELNHEVVDANGRRRRIDAAYPTLGVAVELDGRLWHGLAVDRNEDYRRQNALSLMGWRCFLRFTWADVTKDPDGVVHDVARALAAAEGGGGPTERRSNGETVQRSPASQAIRECRENCVEAG